MSADARHGTPLLLACLALGGCRESPTDAVIYTSVDDVIARPILADLERATGLRVLTVHDVEATKTTGLFHRLLAERERPLADVFWCSEPARMAQLEAAGMLAPYDPPAAAGIPAGCRSAAHAWTGLAARARVLIYNTRRVAEAERPRSIADLAAPRFRGEAAISDPLFGTMATHAGALWAVLGRERAIAFFETLRQNEVKVVAGNSVVRDRVASGELRCGVTDTDDAAVALARGLPVGVVFPDQEPGFPGQEAPLGTFVFPTAVGLIAGGPHPEAGKRVIDYLLRPETEEALARSEAAFLPLRPGVAGATSLAWPAGLRTLEVPAADLARAIEEGAGELRRLSLR